MVIYRIVHIMDLAALAPILLALLISATAMPSNITQGPVNALKKVGDSVSLECVTSSKNCSQVEWKKMEGAQTPKDVYRYGTGILNGFPRERYSVSSTGGCSLTITQLNISDSGRFSCVLTVDEEVKRSSILVVINVTEACLSNVTSNALKQYDRYSFWTAIEVPPKSLEPSTVTLSFFENKAADETHTTDNSQPLTVKTTLTGIAKKHDITRVCTVFLDPYTADGFDTSVVTLDVCTTQKLIVSYGAADGRPFLTSLLLLLCLSLYEINSELFIFAS